MGVLGAGRELGDGAGHDSVANATGYPKRSALAVVAVLGATIFAFERVGAERKVQDEAPVRGSRDRRDFPSVRTERANASRYAAIGAGVRATDLA
jgi:hypothetical protein